jgi:hypothetical protein
VNTFTNAVVLLGLAAILYVIHTRRKAMATAKENLTREVAENKTVMGSAATLLGNLKQRLDDAIASGDPADLQALSDELDTNSNALAAAVAANTPAAAEVPTPPAEPT